MKTVVCSGYFDPLHVGHLDYLEAAAKLGDRLLVIVNNDEQAALKKGRAFMPQYDRVRIVSALRMVSVVVLSLDEDASVCATLRNLRPVHETQVIFANGGDRAEDEIPEATVCAELGIDMVFRVGGEKVASSSDLIEYAASERFLAWLDEVDDGRS